MISLVIPAYNEAKMIVHTLQACSDYLAGRFEKAQIILADDGSTDDTLILARSVPGIEVVSYPENRGKGFALRQGMKRAEGELVFFTDADLPYGVEHIARAVRLFRQGADMVIGCRDDARNGYPLTRKVVSRGCQALCSRFLHLPAYDMQCGFKALTREAARLLLPKCRLDGFGFDMELLCLADKYDMKISTLPVRMQQYRADSKVKLLSDSWRVMKDLIKMKQLDRKAGDRSGALYREKSANA